MPVLKGTARLGTGIHAGLFEVTLRRDSLLGRNVEVGLVSSVITSFYLAAVARAVAAALRGRVSVMRVPLCCNSGTVKGLSTLAPRPSICIP